MNSAALAKKIVDATEKHGCAAVIELAIRGYKGPEVFTFDELNAIQDEAKAREALMPSSIWEI